MRVKTLRDEDFTNYKEPVMLIGTVSCTGKCCKEAGIPLSVCQNNELCNSLTLKVSDDRVIKRYLSNDITKGICFGGLEPFDQFSEIKDFVTELREKYNCNDTVIIYTGYYPDEIKEQVEALKQFPNIIIKFGRYIPDSEPKYDEVLGVNLASSNQYAEKIS